MLNVVVDIETEDTTATSVVLSIGIVPFIPTNVKTTFNDLLSTSQHLVLSKDAQKHRTSSPGTIEWWQGHGKAAEFVLNGTLDPKNLHELLQPTYDLMAATNTPRRKVKWWARGPHFDMAILDNLAQSCEIESPWRYSNVRDVRTQCGYRSTEDWNELMMNHHPDHKELMVAHNAAHDAAYDALRLIHSYQERPWLM